MKPAKWHTVPMSAIAGGRLRSQAIACSVLQSKGKTESMQPLVASGNKVAIVDCSRNTDLPAMRTLAKVWEESDETGFAM